MARLEHYIPVGRERLRCGYTTGTCAAAAARAAAQRLLSSYNAYREVTISAGTYPGQDADVQTVGVKAVLLASDSLPAKQVQQLTELLFSSREALEEQLGLALDPETDAVEGVGIPFHAGAAAWYKQAGITVD